MVSNQVLQNTIEGIKEISHLELGVMDSDGREVAVTAPVFANAAAAIPDFANSPADSQSAGPYQFFKVMDEQQLEYVIVVYGETDSSLLIGRMAAFQLKGLMSAFKERYDKDSFMKNLLLDNLLLIDIYSRAKKLHIASDAQRVVMIIETGLERDRNVLEVVQEFIGTTTTDFVTAVDESNVVVVKDLTDGSRIKDIEKTANAIDAHLKKLGISGARIAYGTVVGEIKEVSRSYKEAKMALDAHPAVQDVHQRDLQGQESRGVRSGDAGYDQQVLREQPQCLRDIKAAVHSQEHAGLPPGQTAEEHRARSARV